MIGKTVGDSKAESTFESLEGVGAGAWKQVESRPRPYSSASPQEKSEDCASLFSPYPKAIPRRVEAGLPARATHPTG